MRSCLQSPCDDTPLLILADWLDEAGSDSNAAWAEYLRARVEGDRHPPMSRAWSEFQAIAARQAPLIQARLTITFIGKNKSILPFLRILPAPNLTIEIGEADVPLAAIELVPESVARENVLLPVERVDNTLVMIARGLPDTMIETLRYVLNRDVVVFHGGHDDILDAINRHYGNTETESIDSVSYESPLIGLEGDTGEIYGIFHTAFSSGATGFEMRRGAKDSMVQYVHPAGLTEPERLYAGRTYDQLLAHFLSEASARPYRANNLISLDFDVPLLSGRRFPVTLERPDQGRLGNWLRGRSTRWFRLRFRWEDREPSR